VFGSLDYELDTRVVPVITVASVERTARDIASWSIYVSNAAGDYPHVNVFNNWAVGTNVYLIVRNLQARRIIGSGPINIYPTYSGTLAAGTPMPTDDQSEVTVGIARFLDKRVIIWGASNTTDYSASATPFQLWSRADNPYVQWPGEYTLGPQHGMSFQSSTTNEALSVLGTVEVVGA
jgi:hypothetical protein